MRNPVRLKNLRMRFLPVAAAVGLVLAWASPGPSSLALGTTVALLGLGLRAWGAGHLVKRDQLSLGGPYSHVRHPLYLGTLVICVGFGVALGAAGVWLLAALLVWFFASYFPAKERAESQLLEQRYGGAYVHYRARVRALLPSRTAYAAPGGSDEPSARWSGASYADNNELGTALGVAAGLVLLALRAAQT